MKTLPDDLDRLPKMSQGDERPSLLPSGRAERAPGMTSGEWTLLGGVALIVVSGVLLFFAYGLASKIVTDDQPQYWSVILKTMFTLAPCGPMTWAGLSGLILGVVFVFAGIRSVRVRSRVS